MVLIAWEDDHDDKIAQCCDCENDRDDEITEYAINAVTWSILSEKVSVVALSYVPVSTEHLSL